MKIVILSIFFLLVAKLQYAQIQLEGPYPGWINVKQRYGAKGDGKTDDTKAIQRAVDSFSDRGLNVRMQKEKIQFVLYFPKGIYNISKKILVKGRIGFSIIGENPTNTIFSWKGKDVDTMLHFDGSAYYQVSRFSFKTNGRKQINGIGMHWKEKFVTTTARSYASLNNEFSDLIFNDKFNRAMSCGTYGGEGTGSNDSEITIKRCVFNSNFTGLEIQGYNALDYWIWDCKFTNCRIGVKNSSGNYHIYNSWFQKIDSVAIANKNGYYTSVRNCTFKEVRIMSWDDGGSCNPFKRVFQNNYISNTELTPIQYFHRGQVTLLDNVFENIKADKILEYGGWCKGNYGVLSLGNVYKTNSPFFRHQKTHPTNEVSDDKNISTKKIGSPTFFTYIKSKEIVQQIPINSTTKQIQEILNNSTATTFYFYAAIYNVTETIKIPANKKITLVGEGLLYSTILLANNYNFKGNAIIEVPYTSKVSLMNLSIDCSPKSNALTGIKYLSKLDAQNSFWIDQIYVECDTSLLVNQTNQTTIYKTNSFYSDNNVLLEPTNYFAIGAQAVGTRLANNATSINLDCWWEGNKKQLNFDGNGTLLIDGSKWVPYKDENLNEHFFKNYTGKLFLSNMYIIDKIIENGLSNEDLDFYIYNIHFYADNGVQKFNNLKNKGVAKGISYESLINVAAPGNPIISQDDYKNISEQETKKLQKDYHQLMQKASNAIGKITGIKSDYANVIGRVHFANLKYAIQIVP